MPQTREATGLSHNTTVLFGLPGVRVQRVEQVGFGERVVHVQTDNESASGCPACGVVSTSAKGRITISPGDLPYRETGISVCVAQASVAAYRAGVRSRVVHRGDRRGPCRAADYGQV